MSNPSYPPVAAQDRLFCWTSDWAQDHNSDTFSNLPPPLAYLALDSLRSSLAPSTCSTYAAGLLRFVQFCDTWKIPDADRMPASHALLCAFIGTHKGSVNGKTVKNWLSGLKAWHDVHDAPWHGDHRWVQMARVTANKEGTSHCRPARAPVSLEHLAALRRAINPTNSFHAAVWAAAECGTFGCRRLGEVTVPSVKGFDPRYHVSRSAT